ncbi:MAG: hypothetical protein ACI9EF_002224 [Pseudohongiellaceae bacterium]|jgi:hypothetical protein
MPDALFHGPHMLATLLIIVALAAQAFTQSTAASWHELPLREGVELSFKLGLPDGFEASQTYPTLIALPPGPQTREMVEASWTRYWGKQASQRGWIVVSPAAPQGQSFYSGAEKLLPALFQHIHETYNVEHGAFHLAGVSNGGRSAFRLATQSPDAFLSLTVLPGFPPTEADEARLGALIQLPVTMYAGGDDTMWVERMDKTAEQLRGLGVSVTTTVLPGEGHTPPSLDGDSIMIRLEEVRGQLTATAAVNVEDSGSQTTTVFVVRHADRSGHDDALSEAGHARAAALARLLQPTALDAIFSSEYDRTQKTVAPTAEAQGITTQIIPARSDTAAHILKEHSGQTVLVAGHSNTVPLILKGLGIPNVAELSEDAYGDLFVVTITAGQAQLLHLSY